MNDNVTHRPRGFGFVTFESEESVETAVQQTFQTLTGKTVEVKRAVPREGGKNPSKNTTNGASSYGGVPFYQTYPMGMYSPGSQMVYPGGYSPYGYGPAVYGPGYLYGGYGYGVYPGPRGHWNGTGYVTERRSSSSSHHHPVNGEAELESQVQYVASQLGASSLDDRRVSDCWGLNFNCRIRDNYAMESAFRGIIWAVFTNLVAEARENRSNSAMEFQYSMLQREDLRPSPLSLSPLYLPLFLKWWLLMLLLSACI